MAVLVDLDTKHGSHEQKTSSAFIAAFIHLEFSNRMLINCDDLRSCYYCQRTLSQFTLSESESVTGTKQNPQKDLAACDRPKPKDKDSRSFDAPCPPTRTDHRITNSSTRLPHLISLSCLTTTNPISYHIISCVLDSSLPTVRGLRAPCGIYGGMTHVSPASSPLAQREMYM